LIVTSKHHFSTIGKLICTVTGDNQILKDGMLIPSIEDSKATIHIFEEDKESAVAMLSPIAQMYDVRLDVVNLIDGWLRVDVRSKKYGDISKFITSAKQLLLKKLIGSACFVRYIIDMLSRNQKKIIFVESCTGG